MSGIFKNAKFGDMFITNVVGEEAVYLGNGIFDTHVLYVNGHLGCYRAIFNSDGSMKWSAHGMNGRRILNKKKEE